MLSFLIKVSPSLAKARDLMIIGSAINYVVGYVVVAIYAVHNGLGFVRALDAQYIVAGLIPSLLALVLAQVWFGGHAFGGRLVAQSAAATLRRQKADQVPQFWFLLLSKPSPEQYARLRTDTFYLIKGLAPAVVLIFGGYFVRLSRPAWDDWYAMAVVFLGVLIFAVSVGWHAHRKVGPGAGALPREAPIPTLRTAVVMLIFLGPFTATLFFVYAINAFPAIPLEFGGSASRCATAVIKDASLRTALRGDKEDQPVRLWWELAGDPFVFSLPAEPTAKGVARSVWLVPQSAVVALGPCDDKTKPRTTP